MSDAVEAIAIGFSVAIIFCVPFGFAAFMRYLKYKETIALAERGLLRESRKKHNQDTLSWGILIAFIGLGLTIGSIFLGSGVVIILGTVPAFFGLGLIVIYYVKKEENKQEEERDDDPIPPHKVP